MVCEVERQRGGSCFLVATCVIPRHFFCSVPATLSNAVFSLDVETLQVKPHPEVDNEEIEAIAVLRLYICL